MKWSVRVVAIAVCLLSLHASAAQAGRYPIVIVTGDQIEPIGYVSHAAAESVGAGDLTALGYHYQRFGVFWLDVWRWSGEFVLYQGTTYVRLSDKEVDELGGAHVPWRYHLPPGLLVILALIELGAVTRRRRQLRTMLVLGGTWVLLAVVFYVEGLDVECIIPGLLGLHHIVGSWFSVRDDAAREAAADARDADATARADAAAAESAAEAAEDAADAHARHRTAPLPSPPTFETDPFRAPPRTPIVVVQPTRAPSSVPIALDENSEKPKLLT